MPRKTHEINATTAERIKQIRLEAGLTQTEFAERVGYAKNQIVRLENQQLGLSDALAYAIIKAFPKYRKDWLLGISDSKSVQELYADAEATYKKRFADLWQIIKERAETSGKRIVFSSVPDELTSRQAETTVFCLIVNSDGHEEHTITVAEAKRLTELTTDFLDFIISKYL